MPARSISARAAAVTFLGNTLNSGRINFGGAGTFTTNGAMTNTGIINAQNGLTSNVVTVGGNYVGGGQFWVDYSTLTASADRLNIGGTASGNTNVAMNRVGARTFVPGGFLPVVTVAGGAPVDCLHLEHAVRADRLHPRQLRAEPRQRQAVRPDPDDQPGIGNAGQHQLYRRSRVGGARRADQPLSEHQAQPVGRTRRRSACGCAVPAAIRARRSDRPSPAGASRSRRPARIRTEHQALTMGADLGILNVGSGWNFHVGVLGGWYDGQAILLPTQRIGVETPFLGGYLAVDNGAFQLDGTIRREWRRYEVVLPSLFGAQRQKLDGSATAGSVHASYRVGEGAASARRRLSASTMPTAASTACRSIRSASISPARTRRRSARPACGSPIAPATTASLVVEPFVSASGLKNWSNYDERGVHLRRARSRTSRSSRTPGTMPSAIPRVWWPGPGTAG